jgi:hypothetical protein
MANYKTILCIKSKGCDCDGLSILDESNIPNDSVGHTSFGYRKIVVVTPNTTYVFSSLVTDLEDESINALTSNGINNFSYNFTDTDVDGIYTVTLYNFPNWDSSAAYLHSSKPIVFYNGVLYKSVRNNTNVNPSTDIDNVYWEVYTISDDTLKTRYAYQKRKVITCISLDDCYERLVKSAFCDIEGDPCGSLCDNKNFSQAMKYNMTKKAMCFSESISDWASVKNQVQILKSICCCGGGC